jgi:hypothetical protein
LCGGCTEPETMNMIPSVTSLELQGGLRFPLSKRLAGMGLKLAAEARGPTRAQVTLVLGSMDDARFRSP